jgi:hypothetical protein
VFDADKLDAIGATGVVRAIAYATRAEMTHTPLPRSSLSKREGWNPGEPAQAHITEPSLRLNENQRSLFTSTGRRIAKRTPPLHVRIFRPCLAVDCVSVDDQRIP